jgi:hypothetical protein
MRYRPPFQEMCGFNLPQQPTEALPCKSRPPRQPKPITTAAISNTQFPSWAPVASVVDEEMSISARCCEGYALRTEVQNLRRGLQGAAVEPLLYMGSMQKTENSLIGGHLQPILPETPLG